MLRSWAWVALGAAFVGCGDAEPLSPREDSGGAAMGGAAMGGAAMGGNAGSGGSVTSGGVWGSGGVPGMGGLSLAAGGLAAGGKTILPPPTPNPAWIYDGVDGGCAALPPGMPVYDCLYESSARYPNPFCYDWSPHPTMTQIVLGGGYPAGCRVALPMAASQGCGPQICECAVRSPGSGNGTTWVCPPD